MAKETPPIACKLTAADRAYVLAYARNAGVSVSELVKRSLRAYLPTHPVDGRVNPTVLDSTPIVLPQTKLTREDTGKNAPIAELSRIDSERRAKNVDSIGFRD